MKLFKKRLPPPPAGPEPVTPIFVERFYLHSGQTVNLDRPRKMNFMMNEYVAGMKVEEDGSFDLTDRTMILTESYYKSVMLGTGDWSGKFIEMPEEPLWSESY